MSGAVRMQRLRGPDHMICVLMMILGTTVTAFLAVLISLVKKRSGTVTSLFGR